MRNLLARSSPMLDLVLFSLLTLGLTAAGFTYQDIYSTRQLASSVRFSFRFSHFPLSFLAFPLLPTCDQHRRRRVTNSVCTKISAALLIDIAVHSVCLCRC